ncbi:MAG TPA: redoxin domain-containing protein [Phenylobacterium sp.]|uniref:redoxin domain-containing protein n=1 Tax=Phenylobacterium sp. TaxID=1871053 RepID=UPI002D5F1CA8|nr:redoxin domain-containing protein [Phenylobacterium sp.]HZZ66686.1 redoxin domain-containing protein [Phenylobacterium sp.]
MNGAKFGILALFASAAALVGCTSDTMTASAVGHASSVAATAAAPAKVDNFMLVDQNLEAHELYRLADAPAVVLVTQQNGDAVVRGLAPQLNKIAADYGQKRVEFMMLNSSAKDSMDAIQAEATKVGYKLPVLMDDKQIIGESLGVTRSAEAVVINPKTWTVTYRGAVSGLPGALDALLAGKTGVVAGPASGGAQIAFASATKVSYAKDVAPILEAKCVACHEEGGIGPFAMNNYAMVKGFAPMIREVIRTDRMPPYHADPRVGHFSDDKRLSPAEIKTIVNWVEEGAPRGDGADPLGAVKHVAAQWPLGKPDLIIDVPAFTIPASGVVDYQRPAVLGTLTEGKWVRASTVKPGSRQGVHHLLTGWMESMLADGKSSETKWAASLGAGYAVGAESSMEPKNAGVYLPPGGAYGFQMHYTPYGKEVVDKSQVALYFYDKPPELIMHSVVVMDPTIEIPAGEARHKEVAYVQFPHDALLYSAFPHAHYRAYSSDLWIQYPDGKMKLLLSLPRYDFNWQRAYTFAEPVKIPAGSKLVAHYVYDNSARNPANPDPKVNVSWGEQSFQEMLFTSLSYRWTDETAEHRVNYEEDLGRTRLLGMMDDNLDGKLSKAELKGGIGRQLLKYFDVLDKNHDGYLDANELAAAQGMMGGRRGGQEASAKPKSEAAQQAAAFNASPTNR